MSFFFVFCLHFFLSLIFTFLSFFFCSFSLSPYLSAFLPFSHLPSLTPSLHVPATISASLFVLLPSSLFHCLPTFLPPILLTASLPCYLPFLPLHPLLLFFFLSPSLFPTLPPSFCLSFLYVPYLPVYTLLFVFI